MKRINGANEIIQKEGSCLLHCLQQGHWLGRLCQAVKYIKTNMSTGHWFIFEEFL